jgi:ribosome biogenesis GTPase / thiamine phosphate phosphatase
MVGTIVKGIAGFYYVKVQDEVIECKARGKFRFDELTPIVGDKVQISSEKGKGVIEKVLPRTTELIRPVVANVSQAFVVFAIKNPDINLDLLNRFLVLCEYNSLKIVVCINKTDLASKEDILEITRILQGTGYDIIYLKAKEGEGLEDIITRLSNNVTVLCGPSGAGKSTLINNLSGRKLMETGEVSEKIGRGKHTTRHSELIQINDGFLVDTPGFSTIDMDFIDKEKLQLCFPEFAEYLGNCRFSGCLHHKEPGCAVKKALEEGNINNIRYEFYIKTLEELANRRNKKW